MKVIGIIPARYGSTRFPGKPLAMIGGKTMIQRVYEQAKQAIEEVWVATDNERIQYEVESFGGCAVMTSSSCRNGTERCAEVVQQLLIEPDTIVINIQGDMPFITPQHIYQVLDLFYNKANDVQIATLVTPLKEGELENENIVKASVSSGVSIYYSRTPLTSKHFFKHIGLYAFRKETLLEIAALPQTKLELRQSLEQLRWIENEYVIHCAISDKDVLSVDTPEDLIRAEEYAEKEKPKEMTKEELAIKWIPVPEWQVFRDEFMIDLNEVIREELIKFDKWCETLSTKYYKYAANDLVDEYLKSQQK